MKKILCAAALAVLAMGLQAGAHAADAKGAAAAAPAAGSCEDKAIDKNGKKLAGAAKTSFMKKCEADAKDGK